MSKYSTEQKQEVVRQMLEDKASAQSAARSIGANKSDAQKWLKLYKEHGPEGLVMKRGTYDGKFKEKVVEYMHTHRLSIGDTAAKFGIPSHTTVGKWERIYYEEGAAALYKDNRGRKPMTGERKPRKPKLDKKTEEDLIAENQRLRMENAYLKKLNALVQERVQRENGKKH